MKLAPRLHLFRGAALKLKLMLPPLCIPTDRLEEYHFDRITDPTELAIIEEHLLYCKRCLDYMEAIERFVAMVNVGTRAGGFDVDLLAEDFKLKI